MKMSEHNAQEPWKRKK